MEIHRFARRALTIGAHAVLWSASLFLAFAVRFEGDVPRDMLARALTVLPLVLVVRAATFWHAGLFHGMLRYAGMPDFKAIVRWTTLASFFVGFAGLIVHRLTLPRSIYFLEWLTSLATAGGLRFLIRIVQDRKSGGLQRHANVPQALLLGAGNAAELLLRDLHRSPAPTMQIACILDDDRSKHGSLLHGIRIIGPIESDTLRAIVESTGVKRAVLAMPTAPGVRTREILEMCRAAGVTLQMVPSLQQIADGNVRVSLLRDVAIDDLLRREPIRLDAGGISQVIAGRNVLVTGAAGSIGSEIVRQIALFKPAKVVLLDHNENGLFFLDRELRAAFPNINFEIKLGNIRDKTRIDQVFRETSPHVVYHAAAHKHVPLMELNPSEAVRNNVIGTKVVADAAADHGCDAFVLISTDKAVNPTSVMGTTKRVAEMYVQSRSSTSSTRFVAVRFGNVLGSAGSVVPIFRSQIEAGGPVQVTHPDMRRFFMTIPEACQLVLQASALGRGGEIFILDMGEPVKIVDLARDMIVLSGLKPGVDIQIEFSGIRPGEKLYEELLLDDETALPTAHSKIRMARIAPQEHAQVLAAVERLERLANQVGDVATVRAELAVLVPEATLGGTGSPAPADTPPRTAPISALVS